MLTFNKVEVGATSDNIKNCDLGCHGHLCFSNNDMAFKWICYGCDGDSMFQGIQLM
jgi:hypothetical protein